jgi:hypothetical protein
LSGDSNTILNTIAGAILGFGAAIFAEPLRQWIFRPKLKLEFGDDPGCKARTPEEADIPSSPRPLHSIHEAEYIRIKVTNKKRIIAKGCRAYLIAVEKADESGDFKPTIYSDSIPLAWSCRDKQAYDPLDLPRGVAQFIDVVSTRSVSQDFKAEIKLIPFRYLALFKEHGAFRFTVLVSGENLKPIFIKIVFRWSGLWDRYEASMG